MQFISRFFVLFSFCCFVLTGCLFNEGESVCKLDPTDPRCTQYQVCGQICSEESKPYCDEALKQCVRCIPGNNHCAVGLNCDAELRACVEVRCSSNDDCQGDQICNLANELCEMPPPEPDCTEDAQCADARFPACVSEQCRECSDSNASACADKEKCEVASSRCVLKTCEDLQGVCGVEGDLADKPFCDEGSVACVQCLADGDCADVEGKPLCSPQNTCVPRCTEEADCADDLLRCDVDAGRCVRKSCADEGLVCGEGDFADEPFCDADALQCVACLADTDCAGSGFRCNADKACVPECSEDAQCAERGLVCDVAEGACVQCTASSDCTNPLAAKCSGANTCIPCEEGQDVDVVNPANPQDCAGVEDMPYCRILDNRTNQCVACLTDDHCLLAEQPMCDPKTNICEACITDTDCPDDDLAQCRDNTCRGCSGHIQCTEPDAGRCLIPADQAALGLDAQGTCQPCENDNHCIGNRGGSYCSTDANPNTCVMCTDDDHCAGNELEPTCIRNTCAAVECNMLGCPLSVILYSCEDRGGRSVCVPNG